MNKDKNLYFITMLANAFESPNPIDALRNAIKEIKSLGEKEEYRDGYQYFRELIQDSLTSSMQNEVDKKRLIEKIITLLLSDDIQFSEENKTELLNKIKNNPAISNKYIKIKEKYFKHIPLEIAIYKKGLIINSQLTEEGINEVAFDGIEYGYYSISLSNGRLLWEGELTKKEIIWEEAFPEQPYSMAADTGVKDMAATRTEELIPGEMTMTVFAGLESGRIVIKLK